jgi:septum site-determining protein MinC
LLLMPAVEPSSPSSVFDLRSAALTHVALVLKTTDLGALAQELHARFGPTPDLFDHDPVAIDLTHVREDPQPLDFPALIALLRAYKMAPIAVKAGSAAQTAAAWEAGLVAAPAGGTVRVSAMPGSAGNAAKASNATSASGAGVADNEGTAGGGGGAGNTAKATDTTGATGAGGADNEGMAGSGGSTGSPGKAGGGISAGNPGTAGGTSNGDGAGASLHATTSADADTAADAAAAPLDLATTKIVDKPLRSGQRVYAKGGDLIVLAVVSFGAEVIADGNIHVYAPLRGRAIAGAAGLATARIFTTCMEAQLVSIAGLYRAVETALPDDVLGKPAQVRRDGDKLVVEALKV